jgi:predicted nucleic acid-binding protein
MSRTVAPMKGVFDCMIFLHARANEDSPAAGALDLLDAGEIKLYVSEPILEEVRKVLNRDEVRTALPQITDVRVEALFRRLDDKATTVRHVPKVFAFPRDPAMSLISILPSLRKPLFSLAATGTCWT